VKDINLIIDQSKHRTNASSNSWSDL